MALVQLWPAHLKDEAMALQGDRTGRLTVPLDGAGGQSIALGPALDPAAIERLRLLDPGGAQGLLERVLRAYETSLERHLVEIRSSRSDPVRLQRAAHTLKSSSAAVGALDFSQRCAVVEHLLRHVKVLPATAELEALLDEGQRVLAAVGAMLAA